VTDHRRKVFAVVVAVGITLASVATGAAAQTEPTAKKKVVLRVGLTQDVDSLNTTVGALVADFDVWNLQYATLTDKAADDFHTIPGLAESWKASNNGLTYTYTLRDNLKWSDNEPLTADDIAYTINRAREEDWLNYDPTTNNVTAKALDPKTVEITSSVPDPKLPTMDVYILPKHIYSKISADDLASYAAEDGVGSGPFVLKERKKGQFWRLVANPNYWGGRPAIDEIVFQPFKNSQAMADALVNNQLDAAHEVPASRFEQLKNTKNIKAIEGQQGSFDELALNSGAGLKGHPALKDVRVRQAIAHAIDKETIESRVYNNLSKVADAVSPSANPEWTPEIPAADKFDFDLAEANKILDDAGYKDTNGDGVREMPGGGEALRFKYAERSESEYSGPIREFVTGWLKEIGIATTVKVYNDTQLTPAIGKGDVDIFSWGWTPYVDPDPQLSYFRCDQVASDPEDPTNYYNDASWCNKEYDQLFDQQTKELDHDKRVDIVHQMLTLMYEQSPYIMLDYSPELQAYRTDKFTGWTPQPADGGPVLFTNTSPTYFNLKPIADTNDDDGGGGGGAAGVVIAVVAVGAVAILGGAYLIRRRASAGERE
jgi:peptide/nickel transport system substrate-binding protein